MSPAVSGIWAEDGGAGALGRSLFWLYIQDICVDQLNRSSWEKGTSGVKIPPSDWPAGKLVGSFQINDSFQRALPLWVVLPLGRWFGVV